MECGTSAASRPKRAASVPRFLLCRAPDKCQSVHPSPDCVIRSSLKSPCHFLWHIQFYLQKLDIDLPDFPGMGSSDHFEITFIVQDVPGIILPLRNKFFDFLEERGVLVVTPINGHIFGQPGRKSSEAVRRLCL